MELTNAILSRRTRRKFLDKKVEYEKLEKLVDYARYAPMGANMQPLKYMIVDDVLASEVFKFTKWSGYQPENAPGEDERPRAYIAILGDSNIKPNKNFETDAGAAGTIICLAAEDAGLASCWLGAIDREEITKLLKLDENLNLLYLIAIGYSDQKAKSIDCDSDIKYFTDDSNVLTVPKRTLDKILIK